jgi:hypothetical protein
MRRRLDLVADMPDVVDEVFRKYAINYRIHNHGTLPVLVGLIKFPMFRAASLAQERGKVVLFRHWCCPRATASNAENW